MEEKEPLFAGIYLHHGGVKMRESHLAQGREITKDYIIETHSSSESPSHQSSDSEVSSLANGFLIQKDHSVPPNALNDLNCVGLGSSDHQEPITTINLRSQSLSNNSEETSDILLPSQEDESPTESIGNFYEDIQFLRQQSEGAPNSPDSQETPIGFGQDISSSELDSLSSPSEHFLYAEIEKSLDSSRDDLITESIEMELIPDSQGKKRKSTPKPQTPEEGDGETLEVTGILKDLDKGGPDREGMLVGYGHRKSNDEVDEGLARSESRPSTPSGYHSDTTEAAPLPPPPPELLVPNPEVEPGPSSAVAQLQRVEAIKDDESVAVSGSDVDVVVEQPQAEAPAPPAVIFNCVPPGLDILLDAGQLVVHMGNLRHDAVIDPGCRKRMEIIDETRKVLFYAEQGEPPYSEQSFIFHVYDRQRKEVISVYCPSSESCLCCGASWHWFRRCHFQAIVYSPVGCIAGFVRRSHTKFVQEFEILSPQEEVLLLLRGAPNDLEIYSPDLESELGRLSIHGWIGIMHEIRRTGKDYGITFPLDLDVRVKAVLIGAIFSIDWLYSTKGGKVR